MRVIKRGWNMIPFNAKKCLKIVMLVSIAMYLLIVIGDMGDVYITKGHFTNSICKLFFRINTIFIYAPIWHPFLTNKRISFLY